jgi:hypothetical protein
MYLRAISEITAAEGAATGDGASLLDDRGERVKYFHFRTSEHQDHNVVKTYCRHNL